MAAHGFAYEHLRHVDAHKLLEHLGDFSLYEMTNFCIVQTFNFYYAAALFVMSFIEEDPHLLCIPHNSSIKVQKDQCTLNINGVTERCDYSDKATLYVVNKGPVDSIFPSFGLLCSNGLVKEFGLTFFTIGAFTMVPFLSAASDRFGRKTVVLICISVSAFANLLVYIVNDAYTFWILRFIIGASSDGYMTISGIQSSELVAQDVRDWIAVYGITFVGCERLEGVLSAGFFACGLYLSTIRNMAPRNAPLARGTSKTPSIGRLYQS
ncbi:unnamed protein product [Bursaphelenchus xylophilus]|uniref:(pine wood nematode) hypothetical protein n=1 Tax=Bursaphelenchus xylophilus TaxID=6326 RepID=A0A7I8XFG9_BURXY|nr:unnamed protein product [Bursaphelenchus xylophilus]CAG9124299.1 unnamed protein product [Bursaphelenchus xylophilus]